METAKFSSEELLAADKKAYIQRMYDEIDRTSNPYYDNVHKSSMLSQNKCESTSPHSEHSNRGSFATGNGFNSLTSSKSTSNYATKINNSFRASADNYEPASHKHSFTNLHSINQINSSKNL